MAVNLINIGQVANDGTGDDLREAMIKINQNLEELDLRSDDKTTVSNLGSVGEGLFSNRINYDLQFKKIAAGQNVTLTSDLEKITIDISNIGVSALTITSDNGDTLLEGIAELAIEGGDGISTSVVNNTLVITNDYVSELAEDTTPELGGNLNANGFNIINAGTLTGTFIGSLTGLVNGANPADTAYYFNNIDLGGILPNISNTIEFLALTAELDLGTFSVPAVFSIDEGGF